jgi:uncharacterized protein YukE
MTDTSVEPDQMRGAATGINDAATSFDQAIQDFVNTVNGLVEEPGQDMISPLIWGAHSAVFQIAMQCLGSNAQILHTHARKLYSAANNLQATDQANADAFNSMHRGL